MNIDAIADTIRQQFKTIVEPNPIQAARGLLEMERLNQVQREALQRDKSERKVS